MRNRDIPLAKEIETKLKKFDQNKRLLPGIKKKEYLECLVCQIVDSTRRIKFIEIISERDISSLRADPSSDIFDPLRAAIYQKRKNNKDEAFWLVFLATHFGKHIKAGWSLTREVYGALNSGIIWNWKRISADPESFKKWLEKNYSVLKDKGKFSNHRKFESLKAEITGKTFSTYIDWVGKSKCHKALIKNAKKQVGDDSRDIFGHLYKTMGSVFRFGRLAKFDYLTMIGKLGLASIEPGSTFMQNSTGPVAGANLLFGDSFKVKELDGWLNELEASLRLSFGMQVLEDALCNWQKSPDKFKPYRG